MINLYRIHTQDTVDTAILGMTGLMCCANQESGENVHVIALANVLCLNVYRLTCVQGRARVGPIDH